MKKFIILLAAFVMAFCFAGCGEYKAPVDSGSTVTPGGDTPDIPDEPDGPDEPDIPQDGLFTVTLTYLNRPFSPEQRITAYWNELDSSRIYQAEIGEDGVASIDGLDGDYKVTLSAVPAGYTYDPNSDNLIATNDSKEVTINLMRLTQTTGSGTSFDNDKRINLTALGAYRATLTSPDQQLHYFYTPRASGTYSVVSLIDITANVVNPILDIYISNSGGFTLFSETRDGGGSENTYTKNFKWEINLAAESVNSPFGFVIRADTLNPEAFPVDIDFYIDKDGEFTNEQVKYVPVNVTENLKQTPEYSSSFRYMAYENSQHILDDSLVRLNEELGYYCLYDNVLNDYKRYDDGTPVIIYAKITQSTEIIDLPFTDDTYIRKRMYGKDYTDFIKQYAQYVNSNGVYAVTEELKMFINDYANSQRLFNDGNGTAETYGGYNSTLSAQWMFACGYYPYK